MNTETVTFSSKLLNNLQRIYAWRRVKVVLITCTIFFMLLLLTWEASYFVLVCRILLIGFVLLTVFGLFERWPERLPQWLARWALQVLAVAITVPFAAFLAYSITTIGLDPPWWRDRGRLGGFFSMSMMALLAGPWICVAALFRQIRDEAQKLALKFELERSEFERQALNARLRLLQAQVEPHFLFNTLANVRELVIMGSPQAPAVLDSLIAYLRAAVPRLNEPLATMGQELDLVRAYLEVMHMRMPDRLKFSIHADEGSNTIVCPPMTVLTLVENAMRHGIDPSEEGGHIDVRIILAGDFCIAEVADTGVGMMNSNAQHKDDRAASLGTGLSNLRERLSLAFGKEATLQLNPIYPRGTQADSPLPYSPR